MREDYTWEGQLWLRDVARGNNQARTPWNPELVEQELDLKYYKFDYYVKDMFFDSDTTLALLSTSPSVDPEKTLLSDRQMVATRDQVNEIAGTRRMFAHGVILAERTRVPRADGTGGDGIEGGLLEGLHHRRRVGLPSHL